MPYRLVELQCYELPGNWVTLSSGYCDKGDAELLTVMGSRCADRPLRLVVDRILIGLAWPSEAGVQVVTLNTKIAINGWKPPARRRV
jgi:hypothetical protein